ncbi:MULTISPECIES: acyl carrier protein [Streptomyces]|uniref:Acyl carrier protein n=1 Tax=Streptomyces eurythermus TaxID=42237 RepID=A0ABW6ZBJ4_9ACTN|nr:MULTISPECIES: acyl carrier protein [Streptomyces]QIS68689.1 acyl carrier protein [Streptomyces sp. DSM 40868]
MIPEDVLSGVYADAMDCLQVNLAVLADAAHGPGTHLRLGATIRFSPKWTDPPTVSSTVDERLYEAESLLGLVVTERHHDTDRLLADRRTHYVVADAYTLPWTPYFQQRHMDHSFLVDAGTDEVVVTDAYHNDTQWGAARPTILTLRQDKLRAILSGQRVTSLLVQAGRLWSAAPQPVPADPGIVRRYVAAYRELPDRVEAWDRLTLETWLLARQHLLHAVATGAPEAADPWGRLAQQAFVGGQRLAAGRAEPVELFTALEELLLGHEHARNATASTADSAVRDQVVATIADVLRLPREVVSGAARLADLPQFNSFRLVDVLARLEGATGVVVPGTELTAETLTSVESLTALLARCTEREVFHA